ncbi:MAG: hypothetical protein J0H78_05440 [Rhizobiales bacterium]|nr:hypothetical protein [Hyphomicrobiales bacterium]OJY41168.1 MAG: hypothetical protein BGP08_05040 [Rhizobiales bacterium 64-17]
MSVLLCAGAVLAAPGVVTRAQADADSAIGRPDPVEAEPRIAPTNHPPAPAKPRKSAIPLPKPAPGAPVSTEAKADSKPDAKAETKPAVAAPPAQPATAAMTPRERGVIEAALMFSGDDTGPADGDDAWTSAVKAFQRRINAKVTGTLTPEERERLLAAQKSRESEYGWTLIDDTATGVRLGVPRKLMPIEQTTREGTRFTSRHGNIQVETFRIANGLTLAALFAMERSKPRPRRVETSSLREPRFSIFGMQGLRRFAMHAQAGNGEIRGFTVSYDQALEGMLTPLATAMANSFTAFASGRAPPPDRSQRVVYGSGVIVSATGDIITDRAITEDCQTITVAHLGPAERVATRDSIALLRVYGARNLTPAATGTPGSNSDVIVRAIPDPKMQDGNTEVKETRARLAASGAAVRLDPPPATTSAGAGVFDTEGRLIGLLSPKGMQLASAEAVAPPSGLTPATVVQDLLPGSAKSATTPAAASMVRIVCVRP